jgi:Ca2+-binding EF-hand superfamily protein
MFKINYRFDSDNNGTLTFNEFIIGYSITTEGKLEDKLKYAFEVGLKFVLLDVLI